MDPKAISPEILISGEHNVTFPVVGKEAGQGYLSTKGKNSEYGIVVLQEWWGLNKSICTTTDILASQGFQALAPDLYRGKCASDAEEASHLFGGLDWVGAVLDVQGAVNYLKSLGCKKIGVTGFCMGGALTIASLTQCVNIDAGAPFYGIPNLKQYDLTKVKVPVLAFFGELDKTVGFASVADAQNLEVKAKEAGVNITVKIYPGVEHAFMNQDSAAYNKETATQALQELVAFFNKTFTA